MEEIAIYVFKLDWPAALRVAIFLDFYVRKKNSDGNSAFQILLLLLSSTLCLLE
jgi:hypothetical protein